MVGGEAGQGVQTVGFLLSKAFARGGYHIFLDQDYESRIRGGHNFSRVRVTDTQVNAIAESVDILVALNKESVELHRKEVTGVIIYDGEEIKDIKGDSLFSVPLKRLAADGMMENTVALGAALGMVHYDFKVITKVLRDQFGEGDVREKNVSAARAGFDFARREYHGEFKRSVKPVRHAGHMLLSGTDAIALGAIAAGCKFMSAYPMTPTTPIMEYFASKSKECGLAMVHAEDEIAAINMAIGASFAGVRAMTATSGSGFCLMVEGLGLAGITETPVVIIEGQRPGPAVGLPTRSEQGDLLFLLHAHQGEFPRAILAPSTVEDSFWATVKAFNLADKYQLPVLVMTDHHLATSYSTVEHFALNKVVIDRGVLFSEDSRPEKYLRHKVTQSGISPRALPGLGKALVITDSDEHDEAGHLTESAEIRTAQVQKRLRKLFSLKQEIAEPLRYGPKNADTLLIGWGSTFGPIHEAMEILHRGGAGVNMLHFNELWPFPATAVENALGSARNSYVIENNATGQLATLIRAETGREVSGKILKYDGRPFTPSYIAEAVKKEGC
jgi:2-oxoglutarate ferredoxin oxidoreductase subunit alpha